MKEYTVTIAGIEHTMLLDEDDAKRLEGSEATEVGGSKSSAPANKSRTSTSKNRD